MVYLFVTTYLLGAFSPAHVITRWRTGQDIRDIGSGNAGAANVARQLGFQWGVLVLLLDVAKGAFAVFLAGYFFGGDPWTVFAAALGVIIGHNWPVTLRFRGGRGVAPFVGVWLAIVPLLALLALAAAGLVLLITRRPVAMIASGILLFNALVFLTGQPWPLVVQALALSAFLVVTHVVTVRDSLLAAIRARRWADILSAE